jgi:hypothetical protein
MADVEGKATEEGDMDVAGSDPTRRSPGQYARETVLRLRLRTLVALGVLAVATALLGRSFGLHDVRFLISELVLLATIFVVLRYVVPLVERRDRGASGEEHVGWLLDEMAESGWEVIHDASLGRGNVDHILIGPGGVFTVETKSTPGPVRVSRLHGGILGQAQAQRRSIERVTGIAVEPLLVFSRGVRIVPARMLLGYLSRKEPALSRTEIGRAHSLVVAALLETEPRRTLAGDRWRLLR